MLCDVCHMRKGIRKFIDFFWNFNPRKQESSIAEKMRSAITACKRRLLNSYWIFVGICIVYARRTYSFCTYMICVSMYIKRNSWTCAWGTQMWGDDSAQLSIAWWWWNLRISYNKENNIRFQLNYLTSPERYLCRL